MYIITVQSSNRSPHTHGTKAHSLRGGSGRGRQILNSTTGALVGPFRSSATGACLLLDAIVSHQQDKGRAAKAGSP